MICSLGDAMDLTRSGVSRLNMKKNNEYIYMRTLDGLLDSNPLVDYALAFIPRLSNGFGNFPPRLANLVFQR